MGGTGQTLQSLSVKPAYGSCSLTNPEKHSSPFNVEPSRKDGEEGGSNHPFDLPSSLPALQSWRPRYG